MDSELKFKLKMKMKLKGEYKGLPSVSEMRGNQALRWGTGLEHRGRP